MVTSSTSVMGGQPVVESKEDRAAKTKANRQAGLEKARQIKAEKLASGELVIAPKAKQRGIFWTELFLVYMRNREVRGSKDIPFIIKETDDTMKMLEEADKI